MSYSNNYVKGKKRKKVFWPVSNFSSKPGNNRHSYLYTCDHVYWILRNAFSSSSSSKLLFSNTVVCSIIEMALKVNKVLISDAVDVSCREILETAGVAVDYKPGMSKEDLLQCIKVSH